MKFEIQVSKTFLKFAYLFKTTHLDSVPFQNTFPYSRNTIFQHSYVAFNSNHTRVEYGLGPTAFLLNSLLRNNIMILAGNLTSSIHFYRSRYTEVAFPPHPSESLHNHPVQCQTCNSLICNLARQGTPRQGKKLREGIMMSLRWCQYSSPDTSFRVSM